MCSALLLWADGKNNCSRNTVASSQILQVVVLPFNLKKTIAIFIQKALWGFCWHWGYTQLENFALDLASFELMFCGFRWWQDALKDCANDLLLFVFPFLEIWAWVLRSLLRIIDPSIKECHCLNITSLNLRANFYLFFLFELLKNAPF